MAGTLSCLAVPDSSTLFNRTNLVAWCIVPFDASRRNPEQRAEMLQKLGISHYAYDYRDEHIPTFDAEMEEIKKRNIELTAWWFPGSLDDTARKILDVIKRHDLKPQLWITGGGGPTANAEEQRARVEGEANRIQPIADEAAKLGCKVALYNHGSWFGEPENQIEIITCLKQRHGITNVGIVYNQHHGHHHVDGFAKLMQTMKPYLLTLNLNGMTRDGDKIDKKIMPIGQGELDLQLLKIIRDSGWRGPIGILNHTDEDAEARLLDNLEGLQWVKQQLDGKPAGATPKPRSWKEPKSATNREDLETVPSINPKFGSALASGMVVAGHDNYRKLPITVECRARLSSKNGFNILVASDPKGSAEHWELYSYVGTGLFSIYQPGRGGEVRSKIDICDGQWHRLAAIMEENRVRLYVDGNLAADAPVQTLAGTKLSGGLSFARLVEGGIGCDGFIDEVRISKGPRAIGKGGEEPLQRDADTLAFWNFDELPKPVSSRDPWAIEDAAARAALPEFKEIPAARVSELTPAGTNSSASRTSWHRSHGDATSGRFSALSQINRTNVKELKVAWTYHSKDGQGNIQCNPIIVEGVMYAPTVGHHIVAVNAATGVELWRFKPEAEKGGLRLEDIPARRGLLYWPGRKATTSRLYFTAGNWLYALDPKTGKLVSGFGQDGRTHIPTGGTVAGAVFEGVLVLPGFEKDVFGYDVVTGELLWTFHTIPQPGEFGYDTWSGAASGANCWGGMALDEQRGIAYVSTGSPKPNFIGGTHRGDNLFSDCLIALDALTGKRLWHFQEIRHDIWDLDIPAPPNLVTITREGIRIDAVAQVTKLGNTLLLDRVTGKPIFPFRLQRAPTSKLPGEETAEYQPAPQLPEPFGRQMFTAGDITTRNEDARDYIQKRVANANYGRFEPFQEGKPTIMYGIHGGAEWTGSAFDPSTGFLYVSANEIPWIISVFRDDNEPAADPNNPTRGEKIYQQTCAPCHGPDRIGVGVAPPLRGLRHRLNDSQVTALLKEGRGLMPAAPPMTAEEQTALLDFLFLRDRPIPQNTNRPAKPSFTNNGYPRLLDQEGYPGNKPPWGTLNCLDLNTGKMRWKVPLGEYPELTAEGIARTGTENFGGAMVTAGGIVFCAGTKDGKIRAFDAATGEELWEHALPWGGYAPPATYAVDGRQYVVIAASGGGKLGGPTGDAYVAFVLPEVGRR